MFLFVAESNSSDSEAPSYAQGMTYYHPKEPEIEKEKESSEEESDEEEDNSSLNLQVASVFICIFKRISIHIINNHNLIS